MVYCDSLKQKNIRLNKIGKEEKKVKNIRKFF